MRSYASICAVLFLSSALHAAEKCSAEVKFLLSPPTIQLVIASLNFGKETAGRVYFFDTDDLTLLKEGVIMRVRQGVTNDLTVKVRVPGRDRQVIAIQLGQHFPCETNRTGSGVDTDYSVRRQYKGLPVPEIGSDISGVLSSRQKRLLQQAGVSIDWDRVKRIADVKVTKWEGATQGPFGKFTLEMWEWPTGNILELSAKVTSDEGPATYADLQQLVNGKGLSLSPSQGSKTNIILETLTNQRSPLR